MATKAPPAKELRTGERVVATVDMPAIPAGTPGKVSFVAGFTWIRYWVRFENGVVRGSLHRDKLARPDEWQAILERRTNGDTDDGAPGDSAGAGPDAGPSDDPHAVEETRTVNGVAVPSHLLERSRLRREALGL